MSDTLLTVKDLRVMYKTDLETVCAVNGAGFSLKKKETIGLVGETGAGKTTIALSILRLLPERTAKIMQGQVFFEGSDLLTLTESQMQKIRGKDISMIFQDPMTSLNPVHTVGSQIFEALRFHSAHEKTKAELEARVEEMLELVGIPKSRKNDYPHQFSGGMKQRVVIAIALACSPKLIIADEPTTALDVTIQAQVLMMMNELKQKLHTSMILITHDLGVVAQTCDKVAIVYAGEIIETGIASDIFSKGNHHPYTTGLFGSIPDLYSETRRLSPIEGLMPDPTNLPKGCKFHPRCPKCMDVCRHKQPPVAQTGTHAIQCHLFNS